MKNKKMKQYLSIGIILLIIAIFGLFIYYKSYYSLEKVKEIISQRKELSANVQIIETYFDENNKQIAYFDNYIKDNMCYIAQYDNNHKYAESLIDVNNYCISIVHDTKHIIRTTSSEKITALGEEEFFIKVNQNANYKYYGREEVNNHDCIKFSLCLQYSDNVELTYYYINLEDNHIIKLENYIGSSINDLSLKNSITYEYIYNSVVDTDILKFDKNNYLDYQYDEL
ncbi:MAG: hypothetical protein J6A36_06195 [Clostridia bacterium]|nr:hypothetical protein [Clostridia bacterium]